MRPFRAIKRHGLVGAGKLALMHIRRPVNLALSRALKLKAVRSEYGIWMRANWGDTTFNYCVRGSYGRFLSDLLLSQRSEFVFLDIGANQGLYALVAAKNRYCVRAVAFEPVMATFQLLQDNIGLNRATRVIACNFGISSSNETLQISVSAAHSGAASIHHKSDGSSYQQIEVRTGDAISEHIIEALPIIVKVDTEGHEALVIEQLMASSFVADIQAVFYEVDESWVNPADIEAALRAQGFSNFKKVRSGTHYDVLATR